MDNPVKISASAVFYTGSKRAAKENSFYIDGRFLHEYEGGSIYIFIESSSPEHVFAVSDGMEIPMPDKGTSISVLRELKKFHEGIKSSSKGIEVKIDQLVEVVKEASNLVHSIKLGEGQAGSREPAFAGLLICENKVVFLNTGDTRIYLLRGGNIQQFPADHKKAERLLKMGIITDEQVEMLSNRYGITAEHDTREIRKSDIRDLREGDIFLLSSASLVNAVDEERIAGILFESGDIGEAAAALVKEAAQNAGNEDMIALVLGVDRAASESGKSPVIKTKPNSKRYVRRPVGAGKPGGGIPKTARKIISAAIALFIVFGAFYGLYKLWTGLGDRKPDDTGKPSTTDGANQGEKSTQEGQTQDTTASSGEDAAEPGEDTGSTGTDWSKPVTYTIQKGDNLYNISKKFYNDPEKYKLIMEANGINNPNLIQVGKEIIIPDPAAGRP